MVQAWCGTMAAPDLQLECAVSMLKAILPLLLKVTIGLAKVRSPESETTDKVVTPGWLGRATRLICAGVLKVSLVEGVAVSFSVTFKCTSVDDCA